MSNVEEVMQAIQIYDIVFYEPSNFENRLANQLCPNYCCFYLIKKIFEYNRSNSQFQILNGNTKLKTEKQKKVFRHRYLFNTPFSVC